MEKLANGLVAARLEYRRNKSTMSDETKAKVFRILTNAAILAGAAFATTFLQELSHVDFGQSTPLVVALIGIVIKTIQTVVGGAPDYK